MSGVKKDGRGYVRGGKNDERQFVREGFVTSNSGTGYRPIPAGPGQFRVLEAHCGGLLKPGTRDPGPGIGWDRLGPGPRF